MTRYNLHTHTNYSDGSDHPEKYLEEAKKQGLTLLGFSDHSPVPFENNFAIRESKLEDYFRVISALKNDPLVKVLCGIEMDYIPGMTASSGYYRNNFPVDYIIGSIHLVKNPGNDELWFIDGPDISVYDDGLKTVFGGDIRLAVTAYYRQMQEMIASEQVDIIGHMDKIRMYNRDRYFSENASWYVDLVEETLQAIKKKGSIVEVNTRGLYKKRSDSTFPGTAILKRIKELDIPVIVSSDAHKPGELSLLFDETLAELEKQGHSPICPSLPAIPE